MITKAQACALRYREEVHYTGKGGCTRTVGPRGGVKETVTVCRVSGEVQTWKREPERFRLPVKCGMHENGEINQDNTEQWHLVSECPLLGVKVQ